MTTLKNFPWGSENEAFMHYSHVNYVTRHPCSKANQGFTVECEMPNENHSRFLEGCLYYSMLSENTGRKCTPAVTEFSQHLLHPWSTPFACTLNSHFWHVFKKAVFTTYQRTPYLTVANHGSKEKDALSWQVLSEKSMVTGPFLTAQGLPLNQPAVI